MKQNNEAEPVVIFSGTNLQVDIVKTLLYDIQIESFIINELTGTLFPWITTSGGYGPVRLMVASYDFENAKKVVDKYISNKENYEN